MNDGKVDAMPGEAVLRVDFVQEIVSGLDG